ncbi:phosphatase PAP2 family protein [Arsukibacterium indicum]|uniref:undecaprenyl-diphosphate phosphatase n=1 Tax=Arsukibacterium indicum TaxID=2848612 RepID=A0ABS6MLZ3_9GAMM|nr:phosphatase PAP2 family protein [Arsukibacterium indicum]MBV2129826.1 phosphatase PAP2 family protein [Arsukibacterium indicum]
MNTLQKLTLLDTRLFFQVNLIGQLPSVKKLSLGLSRCGDGHLYLIAAMLLWQFDFHQGQQFIQHAVLAFAIELPLYLLLKNAIQRERPRGPTQHGWTPAIHPSDRFSFPSGHTAAAFMFAWLLAAYYPQFTVYYLMLATGIGLSRVLLGVHYPTDILAGAGLGSLIALVVLQTSV